MITLTDMKTVTPEVKDTEYAIRLSVTDPIDDFHQKVPDMAYKVCIMCSPAYFYTSVP